MSSLDEYLDNPPDAGLWDKQNCDRCGKKSRLYCADCLVFVGTPPGAETPTELRLPLEVDILVTAQERKRSSGMHVAVAAPQSVRVVLFDEPEESLPTYQPDRDLVVFPSQSSVTWSDLSEEELAAARRIILIDSRWVQTGAVTGHPKLRGLRHIRIDNPPTVSRFWRWHAKGEGHICTAEATYLVLKDFEEATGRLTSGGRLEDILYLFALVGSRIKDAYESDPRKMGMSMPSSEEAKRRRRVRLVRLDRLVKTKYQGLDAVREKEGEEAAIEEFFRRRRGESVYRCGRGNSSSSSSSGSAAAEGGATRAKPPEGGEGEGGEEEEEKEGGQEEEEEEGGEVKEGEEGMDITEGATDVVEKDARKPPLGEETRTSGKSKSVEDNTL